MFLWQHGQRAPAAPRLQSPQARGGSARRRRPGSRVLAASGGAEPLRFFLVQQHHPHSTRAAAPAGLVRPPWCARRCISGGAS
jgi:hypothetical protein